MVQPVRRSDLNRIISACRQGMLAVVVFSLFINLLMLTAPIYMMQVFDRVLASRNTDTLIFLLLIAIVALTVFGLIDAVRGNILLRIGRWIDEQAGPKILGRSVKSALSSPQNAGVQGLRDLNTVRTFLSGSAMFPILDAPWAPVFLAVMFMLHPTIGWLALGGAVVLFALALWNETATKKLIGISNAASMAATRQAEASVRNADVINAMGMLSSQIERWRTDNNKALVTQATASSRSVSITAASKALRFMLQVGILTVGALLVIRSELSPGAMIASSILMSRALAPVEQAIGSWRSVVSAREAFERLKAQMAADEAADAMPLPIPEGRLTAEGVTYLYPGAKEPTLKVVSFALEPGEIMGLVGPTASGKTTLARLIVGNLAPQRGHVRLDGMDVAQWDPDDLGPHVGYLPQSVELFAGTIGANIARMGEVDPARVVAAARLADVHDMILKLPRGYDTEIGDQGAALSGGQRQRIGLARAVYSEPRLVVLDEPNANLDNDGELALSAAVKRLSDAGVTVVIVSHRPNLLKNVDKLLVLTEGEVRGFGPPDQIVPQVTPTSCEDEKEPKPAKANKTGDKKAGGAKSFAAE